MAEMYADEKQYVVFKLGTEVFGVDINRVKEIIVYQETTKIPRTSDIIEGIINLRGSVIPIYSLRKTFGLAERDRTRNSRIMVVEANGGMVGIVVDGVSEVVMIPGNVIEKPSGMITSEVDANFIDGIAKTGDHLIIILNLDRVICKDYHQAANQ